MTDPSPRTLKAAHWAGCETLGFERSDSIRRADGRAASARVTPSLRAIPRVGSRFSAQTSS